jgi:ubiquinone/menaquinone biosynthesis C-methylase UbiE
MKLQDAIELIRNDSMIRDRPTTWADLGCGSGLFTQALACFLQNGSMVYAVDKNKATLANIKPLNKGVVLQKMTADFVLQELPFQHLDGVLMANALHFVQDKISFLQKAKNWLQPGGCFLVVEYDTDTANPWVPYPVSFAALQRLFHKLGYSEVEELHRRSSIYNRADMYAALVQKGNQVPGSTE